MANQYVVTARDALAARLEERHGSCMSWRKVGAEFGISGGMAHRIARRGYLPKSRIIRRRLKLVKSGLPRLDRCKLALELLGLLNGPAPAVPSRRADAQRTTR